jgi:formamidopyrimidine-DNA glycosylase
VNPPRPVDTFSGAEYQRLYESLRETIDEALRDGGVHTLPLSSHRKPGEHCPRDGAELRRTTVGGRTTFWCPVHQAR